MNATCCICGVVFNARSDYGLCQQCVNRDRLRELDRVESATRRARRDGMRASLTLVQWLSTVSDFGGLCCMCGEYGFSVIEIVDPALGLIYDNVVPVCRACHYHRKHGIETAEARIRAYLDNEEREPHALKPDVSVYEPAEYTS